MSKYRVLVVEDQTMPRQLFKLLVDASEEFELAASRVGSPELGEGQYEADLFEGVDPHVDLPVGPSTSEDPR